MNGRGTGPDRSARFLERALVFSFVVQAAAMLSMAILLLPAMPGAAGASDLVRTRYIASHSFLFRLGWFPWQVTALSDLLIGIGLLRAKWIPKAPAVLTMALTAAAIVPDQMGQIAWMTRGIEIAQSGDVPAYLAYESRIFPWTAVWGGTLYTLAALGWTACFAAAGTWSTSLTVVSALVLRRSQPDTAHRWWAPWRHPKRSVGLVLDLVANSRFARALVAWLPPFAMVSDITDVIYVNYVVDAERLAPLVPEGLELQRVGTGGRFGVFTFLTFRHGHFGPRFLGPLRRLLPSPIQSNFRIHVRHPGTGTAGIHFVTPAITSTVYSFGARFMAEGMPIHVLAGAELRADGRGAYTVDLAPGDGSAPDARAELGLLEGVPETGPWSVAFQSFREMLAYVVPQDRALSTQPEMNRRTLQEIQLGIPLEACEPLEGSVESRAAAAIVGDAKPFCFRVPSVRFRFESEERAPLVGG